VNNVMTLSCSTQWIQQPVKVKRGFGAVVRTTDSSDTVVRLDGFSSTRPLVGPSDVEQPFALSLSNRNHQESSDQ
jgi:hypothetical protein